MIGALAVGCYFYKNFFQRSEYGYIRIEESTPKRPTINAQEEDQANADFKRFLAAFVPPQKWVQEMNKSDLAMEEWVERQDWQIEKEVDIYSIINAVRLNNVICQICISNQPEVVQKYIFKKKDGLLCSVSKKVDAYKTDSHKSICQVNGEAIGNFSEVLFRSGYHSLDTVQIVENGTSKGKKIIFTDTANTAFAQTRQEQIEKLPNQISSFCKKWEKVIAPGGLKHLDKMKREENMNNWAATECPYMSERLCQDDNDKRFTSEELKRIDEHVKTLTLIKLNFNAN